MGGGRGRGQLWVLCSAGVELMRLPASCGLCRACRVEGCVCGGGGLGGRLGRTQVQTMILGNWSKPCPTLLSAALSLPCLALP